MQDTQTLFTVSEIELLYRNNMPPAERPVIKTSQAAYELLLKLWDMNKIELVEQVNILLFDPGKHCLGVYCLATGGVTSCIVDSKIVFAAAIKAKASGIIVAHNHPSGSLSPSQADIDLTNKLIKGGDFLDIHMLDHLIVTRNAYYSFADEGFVPHW